MPRIRYAVAMSLDGYIAGPGGEFDSIMSDPAFDISGQFAQFDTFLLGRRTFEITRMPGSPSFPRGSKRFVFSRTLRDEFPGVSIVREASRATIAEIRAKATRDIWLFGGGGLFRSLLDHGLVDTVESKLCRCCSVLASSFCRSRGGSRKAESYRAPCLPIGYCVLGLQRIAKGCLTRRRQSLNCATPNNRFERSRGRLFDEPRRESMIGINQLRLSATQSRVAQTHR
jgi:dihydrofolate reductase